MLQVQVVGVNGVIKGYKCTFIPKKKRVERKYTIVYVIVIHTHPKYDVK